MRAQNWSLAWAGLDGAEAAAALATAWLLARRDQRAGLTALAGGTLLLLDATRTAGRRPWQLDLPRGP